MRLNKTIVNIFGTIATFMLSIPPLSLTALARRHEEREPARPPDMLDIETALKKLDFYAVEPDEKVIVIDPSRQKLYVLQNRVIIKIYDASTSRFGLGNTFGSLKTPTGTHRINEKIGAGAQLFTLFKNAESTGKIRKYGSGITTRILRLTGQEAGINADPRINDKNFDSTPKHVDTYFRNIYIHGIPNEARVGRPASIGCIVMRNADIVELFDMVPAGTLVEILNKTYVAQNE